MSASWQSQQKLDFLQAAKKSSRRESLGAEESYPKSHGGGFILVTASILFPGLEWDLLLALISSLKFQAEVKRFCFLQYI